MRRRSMHDRILIAINYAVGAVTAIAACAMDSESMIPLIVFSIGVAWLSLFAYANGYMEV